MLSLVEVDGGVMIEESAVYEDPPVTVVEAIYEEANYTIVGECKVDRRHAGGDP